MTNSPPDTSADHAETSVGSGSKPGTAKSSSSSWFTVPAPVARLFKTFPLHAYPANTLPARSPPTGPLPTLYVFATDRDALRGLPSFNPACLKWQTILRLAGVQVRLAPSNNHASPTGALPFLIPASSPTGSSSHDYSKQQPRILLPIPSGKLEQYALDHGPPTSRVPDVSAHHPRSEAYQSLLDDRIRSAWLYALYLSPANAPLLDALYVAPVSRSAAVRLAVRLQLVRAAETEIARSGGGRPHVSPAAAYAGAREAFGALSTLLAGSPSGWFFGAPGPTLFDAGVFAYTHLILDGESDGDNTSAAAAAVTTVLPAAWEERTLVDILLEFPNLRTHRERILERCWGSSSG